MPPHPLLARAAVLSNIFRAFFRAEKSERRLRNNPRMGGLDAGKQLAASGTTILACGSAIFRVLESQR